MVDAELALGLVDVRWATAAVFAGSAAPAQILGATDVQYLLRVVNRETDLIRLSFPSTILHKVGVEQADDGANGHLPVSFKDLAEEEEGDGLCAIL